MRVMIFILLSLMPLCNAAFAQSTVKGKVMEIHTDVMLSGITVENQTQQVIAHTDPMGNFSIKANKGDLLSFYGLNYVPDTIYLTNTKSLTILLELRSNQLKEVKVTQQGVTSSGWVAPAEKGLLGGNTIYYKDGGGLKISYMAAIRLQINAENWKSLSLTASASAP